MSGPTCQSQAPLKRRPVVGLTRPLAPQPRAGGPSSAVDIGHVRRLQPALILSAPRQSLTYFLLLVKQPSAPPPPPLLHHATLAQLSATVRCHTSFCCQSWEPSPSLCTASSRSLRAPSSPFQPRLSASQSPATTGHHSEMPPCS
jgi:hypothetical protein